MVHSLYLVNSNKEFAMKTNETHFSCTLTSDEQRQRRISIRNNMIPHLTDCVRSDGVTKLVFSKPQMTLAMLDQFIAAEGECCNFLKFNVLEKKNYFQLAVTGSVGTEELVRKFLEEASENQHSQCACSTTSKQTNEVAPDNKFKPYIGRILTLCVLCCAAPYVLVTLGLMGVSTGAYFGRWMEASLVFGALTTVAYFSWRHFKKR